jgi:four helix bundle protein
MNFRELDVYTKTKKVIKGMYELRFPNDEKYMLRNQMLRATQSILLNIGEGSAFYGKQRTHFYNIALGSAYECICCLDIYNDNIETVNLSLFDDLNNVCAMLRGMMKVRDNTQSQSTSQSQS